MKVVYVETSAALRAILESGTTPEIEDAIIEADRLVTSRLSLVESARAFLRLRLLGEVPEEQLTRLSAEADDLWAHCDIWELTPEVCELAASLESDAFLRTLDALHLATFLRAQRDLEDLDVLLTVDDRLVSAVEYQRSLAGSFGPEDPGSADPRVG